MALWNRNGHSRGMDGEQEDFDLIFSDEDFEDEEIGVEEGIDYGDEIHADEHGDYEDNVCVDESGGCEDGIHVEESDGDDVEEYYDMDDLQADSAEVFSAAQDTEDGYVFGETFADEYDSEEDSVEEYASEEDSFDEFIISEDYEEYTEEEEFPSDAVAEHPFGEGIQIMDLDQAEEEKEDRPGAFALTMKKNRIAISSALLALAVFVVAAVVVVTGRGSESVNAFSAVSSSLEDVEVIGGEGLAELMTSKETEYQATLLSAVEEETTVSKEYEEVEDTEDQIIVSLVMTSVEKDLKIKFTNKTTGKLIANIPFEVKVVDGDGKEYTWTNDDKDGIIYKSGLTAGTYTVSLIALEGELYENYDFSASGTVTVRDTIAYEKVDVSAEIKDETEINVASEEAQVVLEVESVNTDTVAWVESSKTLNSESYTEIDISQIAVPTATSVARSFLATAITNNTSSLTLTVGESGSVSASSDVSDAKLTYESSNESVATVSENGEVKAVSAGTATITITETYTDGGGTEIKTTDSCSVTVNAAKTYSAFTITASDLSLTKDNSGTISVTAANAASGESLTYEYTSSDTGIATVSGSGSSATVRAVGTGSTTIKIKAYYTDQTDVYAETTATVTVSQSYSDISLSLNQTSLSLTAGNTATLTATASGTSGEVLLYEFSSSDSSVATVEDSGNSTTIKGKAAGTATITVKAYYANNTGVSKTATCTVTVSAAAKTYSAITLKLDSSSLSLKAGAESKLTATASDYTSGETLKYTFASTNENIITVSGSGNTCTISAVSAGTAKVTVGVYYEADSSIYTSAECEVTVVASSTTALKTTGGLSVYVLENGEYRIATYDDYYTDGMTFYVKTEAYTYTGWQTIDGYTYYYDADGNYVTGTQVIQGVEYTFNDNGVLQDGSGTFGIDVSSHNGSIDWSAVKNSGVSYAIIRCGYRGYGSGVLVEDSRFRANIQGALSAGIKVGVYFFSQAVTTTEAVEEASMVLELISGYNISMPVYIDVEYSNSAHDGRADSLGVSDRTAIVKAFCQTIANSGYTAGIYANKTWLTSYLDMAQLSSYKVWLAQYAASPTYSGSYHMWQYSSSGSISGISGNVDLNVWYY